MPRYTPISLVSAAVIGLANYYVLVFMWGYIAMYSPLPQWLVGAGLSGGELRAVLVPFDLLVSVLLSLPAAYLICRLRPSRLRWYLSVAIVVSVLWGNRTLFENGALDAYVSGFGWVSEVFALALAVACLVLGSRPNERRASA
jgi:hypothetical protein